MKSILSVKLKILLACLLLTGAFCVCPQPSAAAQLSDIDKRIAAEERHRRELDKKIDDYRRRIREMGSKVQGLLHQIDGLQQNESVAQQELKMLELQQEKIQEDISFLNAEMAREQMKVNELSDRMRLRLVDMYKFGTSQELNMFMSSESLFEAVEAVHLMGILSKHDEFLLTQFKNKCDEIELSRMTMNDHRARLKQKSNELSAQSEKYQKSIRETNSFISSINKQKSLAEKAAREAEDAQKAVGQTIKSLMRKKQESAVKTGRKGSSGTDYLAGRGRGSMFDWPVRGKISSPYGQRVHPVFKTKMMHSGLDIAAPANTAVKAAAPGEVLFVGWLRGYGQVVIIDHGRGYSTVYAHMSGTSVKEGQVVKSGTPVGRVGKTGTATGYHLHFEVRVNSTVKNPLDYLKR